MPLTRKQLEAITVLDWIYSVSPEQRCSGRTTAIAISTIRAAIRNPGHHILVSDHFHTQASHDNLIHTIRLFIDTDKDLRLLDWRHDSRGVTLAVSVSKKLHNWLPTTEGSPSRLFETQIIRKPTTAWDLLLKDDLLT